MFSRIVPPKQNPSWGTTMMRRRRSTIEANRKSTPPNETVPAIPFTGLGSYRRAINFANVDLPAPVGPTNANRSPSATEILMSLNAGRSLPAYPNVTLSTTMAPRSGSWVGSSASATSGTASMMPISLCRAAVDDCTVLYNWLNCWTGSKRLANKSTNAVTVPIETEPRCTSHPPKPMIAPVAAIPANSTSPKYHVLILTLYMCESKRARFD